MRITDARHRGARIGDTLEVGSKEMGKRGLLSKGAMASSLGCVVLTRRLRRASLGYLLTAFLVVIQDIGA